LIVQSVEKGCLSTNVLKSDPLRNKHIELIGELIELIEFIADGAADVIGGSAALGKKRVEEEKEEHEE
jgi:hypothetical protein